MQDFGWGFRVPREAFGGAAPRGSRFENYYKCHSPGFIQRPELEQGGKIILPPSALDSLTRLHIEYPMLFEISNPNLGRRTHCGVLEFIAQEGFCHIPYWMMQHLLIEEGQMVLIKSTALPLGKYVKLQPHTTAFIDISNPRAVLENALRKFATLTKDEVIMINYNNKNYYLTVLETKPADAISIIETDLVLDFAPPLDYKEPPRTTTPAQPIPSKSVDETTSQTPSPGGSSVGKPGSFKAFPGSGMRLKDSTPPSHSATAFSVTPPAGGLTFGRSQPPSRAKKEESDSESEEEEEEDNKKKFVAFSGAGYSLKK
eukprot:TRINITY_DN6024_c0_g2_i1.p1 TRINITY_DN6024_c0_g2~~TRINITY_DN6024_c0_g2_i1.p1  ORF type:complete len:315 (+),score=91.05 TRINITY_DN6024_c0_g2_i1:22-966(+)